MKRLASHAAINISGFLHKSPALAGQCPTLEKQSQDATGQRYDATAADANIAAARASALHTAGNHAESEKVAKDALAKLGIKPGS
jgi:hypothetical protein